MFNALRNTCIVPRARILDPNNTDIGTPISMNASGHTAVNWVFTASASGEYTFLFEAVEDNAACRFFIYDVKITHVGQVLDCEGVEVYRYGYQGSEKDDEVKGGGNSYTTEFRMLDPRLGRWLSIDPLTAQFPWQSPYVSMDNNPLCLNDILGLNAGDYYTEDGKHLGSDGETDDKAYVVDSKNVCYQADGKTVDANKTTGQKLLSIGNKELLDRATWVHGESGGSGEVITTRTQNAGEASQVKDARVVDYYAHAINNAAKTDGDFYKAVKGRMKKKVDGVTVKTSEGYFEGKGVGGNDNSKAFAEARANGMDKLMKLEGAQNSISSVIRCVNGGNDPTGGARAWLGSSDAKKYVLDSAKKTANAVFQFSFSSRSGVFNHSFYRR